MWEKFFFLLVTAGGGGRHLFIFAARIRGRAAFISADLEIHRIIDQNLEDDIWNSDILN